MKKLIATILALITILGCSIPLSGCGKKQSAKEKYGMDYITRSDGTRVWYKTK